MQKAYTIALQPGMEELGKFLEGKGHKICKDGTCGIEPDITLISGINMEWEEMEAHECRIIDDEAQKKMLIMNVTGMSNEEIMDKIEKNYCF